MKVERIESKEGNVWKYVADFEDAVTETVLYKYPTFNDRTVICCSVSSGCPIGCRFCGSGDFFVRQMTADEIVAQVDYVLQDHDIVAADVQRMQIMFMSMGEPLLNRTGLSGAIEQLAVKYPKASLLVSTAAPRVDMTWFNELSKKYDKVGLQFSVHESTDAARDALVPFKNKMTLREISIAGQEWHLMTGRRPFFNYCAHEKNTSISDVDRLLDLFSPKIWECTISVICERDESIAAANERQRALANDFMSEMLGAGYNVRMFDPAGQDDIGGGCGQLWFVQSWADENPELARPSVGRGLPKVHTPTSLEKRCVA
jgi:23S rRNA (adenine2503-C2)-methyltransferase